MCFLPSASGDADHYIVRFYRAFDAGRCEPSHISLFRRDHGPADLREHLLAQDLIYVGGGSVLSLLGVWRAHGIDEVLREAYAAGVVLCGVSAGSLCWFEEGVTAFHGDGAPVRGPGPPALEQHRALRRRARPRPTSTGGGCSTGCGRASRPRTARALHFVDERLHRMVASRPGARAFRMRVAANGRVTRKALRPAYLGDGRRRAEPARRPTAVAAGGVSDAARILALGGGGFTGSVEDSPLDEYVLTLTRRARGRACACCPPPAATPRPRSTASTAPSSRSAASSRTSRCSAWAATRMDLREHLLSRDVIYVGGGSMLNLLALWRVHGVDSLLAEAWQKGVALVGVSAGLDVLVRGRDHPHARSAGPGDRPGPAAVHDVGARRVRPPAPRASTATRIGGGHAGRLRDRGRRGPAVRGRRAGRGRDRAPRRARLPGGRWRGRQVVERPIEPRLLTVDGDGALPEPVSITEFREAAQRRSRSSRNSLRSRPPV